MPTEMQNKLCATAEHDLLTVQDYACLLKMKLGKHKGRKRYYSKKQLIAAIEECAQEISAYVVFNDLQVYGFLNRHSREKYFLK